MSTSIAEEKASNDGASEPRPSRAKLERIPETGAAHEALAAALDALHAEDADWRGARVFSLVYHADDAHAALLKDAHNRYFSENGLNPMAFKSLRRMEADVVRMSADLFHGGEDVVGTMTSGGTESLLLAVKTYRDRARRKRPWIRRPEAVMPETAHPALDKAGHYFGVKIRYAPVNARGEVDLRAMRRLVGRNTVMLVGSAPQYPHGVVDPIVDIARIALDAEVPMHVDSCIGGFMLPWLEQLGEPVPRWDFRVPGVTSISADLHKYGYTAKGASVLLYRDMDHLRDQFFATTDWPGGIYISPSMPGTRPGGPIAAAWAGLQAMGREGYLDHTRRAREAHQRLRRGIESTEGLRVVGSEHTLLLCWASADPAVDVYAVADRLEDKGWHVDRQQHPASLHLTVTSLHLPIVDAYLADVREAVSFVRAHPETKSRGNAAMYGMMAKVPFRGMVKDAVLQVMEKLYGGDGEPLADGSPEDGLVGKIMSRHGAEVLRALDGLERLRGKARALIGRGGSR
jgi:glutamate/tyrosine decarboxylase-like PLP-dependent enzyme